MASYCATRARNACSATLVAKATAVIVAPLRFAIIVGKLNAKAVTWVSTVVWRATNLFAGIVEGYKKKMKCAAAMAIVWFVMDAQL